MKWQSAKKQSPLSRVRSHKFISFLIFIVLLIVGIFIYQKIALEINKRDFQKARSAVDSIYSDIVTQIGVPDNSKHANTCSRPNLTFEEGLLSCRVSISFIYGVSDIGEAASKFALIQKTVNSNQIFKSTSTPATKIIPLQVGATVSSTALDHYTIPNTNMVCGVKYIYDTPSETNLRLLSEGPRLKTFYIIIGCDDWARAQYYPNS